MDGDIDDLIRDLVTQVRGIEGVAAVVLGGSRARNTHTPASDIDLRIYYDPAAPLDITGLGVWRGPLRMRIVRDS